MIDPGKDAQMTRGKSKPAAASAPSPSEAKAIVDAQERMAA
jgi:hypothetical protein